MRRLLNFLRKPRPSQILLLRALVTVVRVRTALSKSSFKRVAEWKPSKQSQPLQSPKAISAAVERVARLVPGATCLTQATAGHYLLALYGHASQIRIGVKPANDAGFSAHAWLLQGETVLLGGAATALSDYRVLTDLDPFTQR